MTQMVDDFDRGFFSFYIWGKSQAYIDLFFTFYFLMFPFSLSLGAGGGEWRGVLLLVLLFEVLVVVRMYGTGMGVIRDGDGGVDECVLCMCLFSVYVCLFWLYLPTLPGHLPTYLSSPT